MFLRRVGAALAVVAAAAVICGPAAIAEPQGVTASATLDGHDVAAGATGDPLPVYPNKNVEFALTVTNHGQNFVQITDVQFIGRVLGLAFFKYATTVDINLAPGATATVNYHLDMTDLKRQATGLVVSELIVRDQAGNNLAVVPTVADVRGSLFSVYGVFGVALLVLTTLALIDAALALARHKGSTNRWWRGLRLLTPGIGIGLVLAFTASVARWWAPRTEWWLVAAGVTAAVFFLLGYFSPTPDRSDADDDVDEFGETDELEAPIDDGPTVEEARNLDDASAQETADLNEETADLGGDKDTVDLGDEDAKKTPQV
jgi:hypothetical protein